MCGICGIWYKGTGKVPSLALLREMTDTLVHRGPDEEGLKVISDIGLGHRRLRIIDLSTGQQPMANEDGSIWVVFNGEIYNFLDLKNDLIKKGHRFHSRCDTEVLVHLYEEYGTAFPEYLRGMFAIAIWDNTEKKLVLCRDRVGVKPLYYSDSDQFIAFASELKTILPLFDTPPDLDPKAISDYFTFGYVPSPMTPFKSIKKLSPGEIVIVRKGQSEVRKYWQLTPSVSAHLDPLEKLSEIVDEATRIRLMSDVDFGGLLSGGIDSSTVCAHMKKYLPAGLKTFSIGFSVDEYNELPYAREVAEHLGTDHFEQVVEPDAISILPELVWHLDEPFADSSAIPTWYVSKMAREHVVMVHSGDGGDELFGGYSRYFNEMRLQKILKVLGKNSFKYAESFFKKIPFTNNTINRLRRIASRAQLDPIERYKSGVGIFVNGFENILNPEVMGLTTGFFDAAFNTSEFDGKIFSLNTLGFVDFKTYLPEDILTKVDRMSMAHSLEARVPLLDHHLVEFAFSLPDEVKFDGNMSGKLLLKQLAAKLVPGSVITRQKKGFSIPLKEWFRSELKEMVMEFKNARNHLSYEYINRETLERMVSDHLSCAFDHSERLWGVLMFQVWLDTFVVKPRAPYRHMER